MSTAVANTPKRPNKRRVSGGRVTPKSGPTKRRLDDEAPEASSRYTPPVPVSYRESPPWVPILMFTFCTLDSTSSSAKSGWPSFFLIRTSSPSSTSTL